MEKNKHFYLKHSQSGLVADVENNSMDVDAYIVLKKKVDNDWESKQVWYYDEKEQVVNVQTGKVIGYIDRDPNTSNHKTLVQKENEHNEKYQWTYDASKKIIYIKQSGPGYSFGPHADNTFDGCKLCVNNNRTNPSPSDLFVIEYKEN